MGPSFLEPAYSAWHRATVPEKAVNIKFGPALRHQRNFGEVIKKYEELKREAEAAAAAGMA